MTPRHISSQYAVQVRDRSGFAHCRSRSSDRPNTAVADDNPNGRFLLTDHALGIGVEHFRKELVGIVGLGKLERVRQTDAVKRAIVLLLADQIVIHVLDVD